MMIHLIVKIGCACSLAHKIFPSRQRGISVTALYICVTVPLYAQILQFPTKVLHSSEPLIMCERKSLLNASREKSSLCLGPVSLHEPSSWQKLCVRAPVYVMPGEMPSSESRRKTQQKGHPALPSQKSNQKH